MKKILMVSGFVFFVLNASAMVDEVFCKRVLVFISEFKPCDNGIVETDATGVSRCARQQNLTDYENFTSYCFSEALKAYGFKDINEEKEQYLRSFLNDKLKDVMPSPDIQRLANVVLPGFCMALYDYKKRCENCLVVQSHTAGILVGESEDESYKEFPLESE